MSRSVTEDCLSLSPFSGTIPGRPMAKPTALRRQTSQTVPTVTVTPVLHVSICTVHNQKLSVAGKLNSARSV